MGLSLAARGVVGIVLLCFSNAAMTTAWYLHLKFKQWPYWQAILISWAIALPEYCLQVPANRIAYAGNGGPFTAPQLKVIQEFISLTAFAIFSTWVLKEKLRWADFGAFVLILAGVLLSLLTKVPSTDPTAIPSAEAAQQPPHRRLLHLAAWHLSQPMQTPSYSSLCKGGHFSRAHQALPSCVQQQQQLELASSGRSSPKDVTKACHPAAQAPEQQRDKENVHTTEEAPCDSRQSSGSQALLATPSQHQQAQQLRRRATQQSEAVHAAAAASQRDTEQLGAGSAARVQLGEELLGAAPGVVVSHEGRASAGMVGVQEDTGGAPTSPPGV